MTRKTKILTVAILTGLVIVLWVSGPKATAFAHDPHEQSHAPASAKKLKNPLTATDENIHTGGALYNKYCASCHGQDGKAKTDVAAGMKVKPADLTALHERTDGEIYWVITNGIKKSGMPAFKAKAGDNERWQMTLYVKHLLGEHPHGAGGE